MNDSGGAVSTLSKYYGVDPDHLVVVHDEIDIGLGQLRVKFGGGDNGHNGLKSVRKSLDTGDFYRVRVGVGRPGNRGEVHDHVLNGFNAAERKELPLLVAEAADAVESLISKGLEPTQQAFNR
jgi:PTH1 family peptidyl-tRNA hydrolase